MRRILLLLSLPGVLWSCGSEPEPPVRRVSKVIVISIDTLRPDFLDVYTPGFGSSPNLERFASEALVFEDVMAQAASTAMSHKSIFYSVYPHVHQTTTKTVPRESEPSPLQVLQANGFVTGAIVGGGQLSKKFGFDRGFADYLELRQVAAEEKAEAGELPDRIEVLEEQATAWLQANHDKPFFLFLHTYAVHCPYEPPPEIRAERTGWYEGEIDPKGKCGKKYYNQRTLSAEDIRFIRDLYAGEVEHVDAFLGRLFERIRALGLWDETMIVFLSDHGESLGDRGGYVGHNTLYDNQVRIPLVVRIPGEAPARYDFPVEAIDVMPTIFDLVGVAPPYELQGRDLLKLRERADDLRARRVRIAEQGGLATVERGPWKLIFDPVGSRPSELYDHSRDPEELTNLAAAEPDLVAELEAHHARVVANDRQLASRFVIEDAPDLDDLTRRELRALGYVD